ncbi:MAG: hypothetical protein CBC12_05345 [Candidatus Puniceispirillum sp. TMED52]|nr:MAG: hypothetical protein CBC12_05345 [Candidatus Puniceispirillum sp. TMED52]RPF82253.1 MAG: hypothetical protein CBC65_000740 [Rhodothermaceae bacterium TMED105]|tara:strand:- start:3925 stop:4392 length:468 start_codon:yes stop_codon:yes gene_type:complete
MPSTSEILKQIKPLLLQGVFFGVVYKGAQGLRKYVQTPVHPLIAERPEIMLTPMRDTLSQIAMLGHDVGLGVILDKCTILLQLGESNDLRAQSQISRLISEIENDVKYIVKNCNATESDYKFRLAENCNTEVIPLLMTQLDDILHNHLLERAPGR